jgi:heptosyltransferase-1
MGVAFGIPTIALFGSTRPYLDTTRRNARVIYHRLDCSPCRRHPTCGGAYTCMRLIEVAEVMDTLSQAMSAEARA